MTDFFFQHDVNKILCLKHTDNCNSMPKYVLDVYIYM